MITKVDYCSWDGDPALLVMYDNGRMDSFVNYGHGWRDAHPADVATKAAVIGRTTFEKQWPDLTLPNDLYRASPTAPSVRGQR